MSIVRMKEDIFEYLLLNTASIMLLNDNDVTVHEVKRGKSFRQKKCY